MITYLRGQLSELCPTSATIECGGVGYLTHISLTTYSNLSNQKGEVKIFTTEVIREDSHQLYGFSSIAERELFSLLISVSGIGPNTARIILSQYNPQELNSILSLGQVDALKAVKGIGLKTAQRIILELKGKVSIDDDATSSSTNSSTSLGGQAQQSSEEAISGLKILGYPEAAAQKAVRQLLSANPASTVQELIKQALKMI